MEILKNKAKRCFMYEIIKQTSNGSELVDLISINQIHSDTVANETVQALCTICKRNATETARERPSKVIITVL